MAPSRCQLLSRAGTIGCQTRSASAKSPARQASWPRRARACSAVGPELCCARWSEATASASLPARVCTSASRCCPSAAVSGNPAAQPGPLLSDAVLQSDQRAHADEVMQPRVLGRQRGERVGHLGQMAKRAGFPEQGGPRRQRDHISGVEGQAFVDPGQRLFSLPGGESRCGRRPRRSGPRGARARNPTLAGSAAAPCAARSASAR